MAAAGRHSDLWRIGHFHRRGRHSRPRQGRARQRTVVLRRRAVRLSVDQEARHSGSVNHMVRTCVALLSIALTIQAAPRKTKAVVLVTVDGLRWQEIFGGIDPRLMNEKSAGMTESGAAALRERLAKETPEARREALLPFFWQKLAPHGIVLGNMNKGSSMRVTNALRGSYPRYSEILTRRSPDNVIKNNDEIRNPAPSILEFLREKLALKRPQVALFASWGVFHFIAEHTP